MNDTTPRAEAEYRQLLLAKSNAERLELGCSLFDASRALVVAGLTAQYHPANKTELMKHVFIRTYGRDLTDEQQRRFLARLETLDSGH